MQTDTHSPPTDALTLDTTFRLLRDPRRRALVSILADREPPVSLSELAAAVAARELEADAAGASDDDAGVSSDAIEIPNDAAEVPPDEAESVAATLHHVHLPKLADGGLVAYDAEQKTVTDAHVETVVPLANLGGDGA